MTASKATPSRSRTTTRQTTLRHLWLASLGAAVVAGRETADAAGTVFAGVAHARGQAVSFAIDARDVAWGGVLTLRERAEPVVGAFAANLGARLQPALATVGMASGSVRRVSKPTARKRRSTARRGGRRSRV